MERTELRMCQLIEGSQAVCRKVCKLSNYPHTCCKRHPDSSDMRRLSVGSRLFVPKSLAFAHDTSASVPHHDIPGRVKETTKRHVDRDAGSPNAAAIKEQCAGLVGCPVIEIPARIEVSDPKPLRLEVVIITPLNSALAWFPFIIVQAIVACECLTVQWTEGRKINDDLRFQPTQGTWTASELHARTCFHLNQNVGH